MPDFIETFALDAVMFKDVETQLRETGDGYMICKPRIARTGIQIYSGAEVGKPEMREVRVYRPETEVFSADAMSSLAHKPVTVEHPPEPVTAKNWRKYAVGRLDDEVVRDGEFIRVPLILMDAEAIEAVKGGKSQLSVGYTAQLNWADGVTPTGEAYNVTQTGIRANHVAITHAARGGPQLRMGDNDRRKTMATRTILVDGISVEMEERDLQVVERRIANLEKEISTAQAALATAQTTFQNDMAASKTETANATAAIQTKEAEIATLKTQLAEAKMSPDKLDKMVTDRVATVQRAKSIIGDSLVVDGKTDADMRKQVVLAKLGDTAKDWNDDMVAASFNTLTVTADSNGNHQGGIQHVVNVVKHGDNGNGDPVGKSYTDYNNDISNRWKTAGVRNAK